MIRVYKTNVNELSKAKSILNDIRKKLPGSDPSFDLEDCDKVLRVELTNGQMQERVIRKILENYGHSIKILP